jgi:hypothetical protein
MKKLFATITATLLFSVSAHANTPYKNLHVEAEVVPAGAGLVYLTAKNDEDVAYVSEISEDYGEKVFIKGTFGENGTTDQYNTREGYEVDASGTLSNYEVKLLIEPSDGYEFVCVTNSVQPSGVYFPDICYQQHTGTGIDDFAFSWTYDTTDIGNLININSVTKTVDGTSDTNGQGRDCVFALNNWNDTPDTKLYVIFRQTGTENPKFDHDYAPLKIGDANADGTIDEKDADAIGEYRLGWGTVNPKYADANGDGEINIADAVKVINIMNGM